MSNRGPWDQARRKYDEWYVASGKFFSFMDPTTQSQQRWTHTGRAEIVKRIPNVFNLEITLKSKQTKARMPAEYSPATSEMLSGFSSLAHLVDAISMGGAKGSTQLSKAINEYIRDNANRRRQNNKARYRS
jgi:hypothetical protein